MAPSKGFDGKCYQLAKYFMPQAPVAAVEELAQAIQDAVEDHLECYEAANGVEPA